MGYTTEFRGSFVAENITPEQINYINAFSNARRMKRDITKLNSPKLGILNPADNTPDSIYGTEGEFYIGDDNIGVLDYNTPPKTQPGLWCQWVINPETNEVEWDGGEKFYNYIEWINYLIETFFKRWGVKLNGEVEWRGEDWDDNGTITVVDNIITIS